MAVSEPGIVAASRVFVRHAGLTPEPVGIGIRRQLLGYGAALMGARVWFDAGAVGARHAHPHAQMSYVESGRFRVTVGDETAVLVAGDSYYAAPHVEHGAVCVERGTLIDVFAPLREDFLPSEIAP